MPQREVLRAHLDLGDGRARELHQPLVRGAVGVDRNRVLGEVVVEPEVHLAVCLAEEHERRLHCLWWWTFQAQARAIVARRTCSS